jgi:putative Mg2+ transporter-C (MgtC) family protein
VHIEVWSDTAATQITLLSLSFVLCAAVGLERQMSQKSAGMRTHTLVGMGSAGFTLVSAFGFGGVLGDTAVLDPSRIAAQIVSGVGFLGAGVIFMRRDVVRGLTTAATIWVSAAIGMACGAGMVVLAVTMTVLQLLALVVLAPLGRLLPASGRKRVVDIHYRDGHGVLREVLRIANEMEFHAAIASTRQLASSGGSAVVAVSLHFSGRHPLDSLVAQLSQLDDVYEVHVGRDAGDWDD